MAVGAVLGVYVCVKSSLELHVWQVLGTSEKMKAFFRSRHGKNIPHPSN